MVNPPKEGTPSYATYQQVILPHTLRTPCFTFARELPPW